MRPHGDVVFKAASGAFSHAMTETEKLTEKFRSTQLDYDIHQLIEDGILFVMPKGHRFAYSRGSGPVGLQRVRLGQHEKVQLEGNNKGMPDWTSPRLITAIYNIYLFCEASEERISKEHCIAIPSRFTEYYRLYDSNTPHLKGNPAFYQLEFIYKKKDLLMWAKEKQKEIYDSAEHYCRAEIAEIEKRLEELKKLRRSKPPFQSAYD